MLKIFSNLSLNMLASVVLIKKKRRSLKLYVKTFPELYEQLGFPLVKPSCSLFWYPLYGAMVPAKHVYYK